MQGQVKLRDLSELQQRILGELVDAGEESVQTLAVTVLDGAGTVAELALFQNALKGLILGGLAWMSTRRGSDRRLEPLARHESLIEIDAIKTFLVYDLAAKCWIDVRRSLPPYGSEYPYVLSSDSGAGVARAILEERGYQWWREK
jgi:hypothetical protein